MSKKSGVSLICTLRHVEKYVYDMITHKYSCRTHKMMTNTGTEIDLTKILKLGESENHGTSSDKQQDLHAIIDGNR